MAQTKTGLCNGALQRLGARRILDISANTPEALQCRQAYDDVRRELLRGPNTWNFAIKRATLAPDSEAPDFDFVYQFTLPTDCIRPLKTNDAYLDWRVEGRKILTNAGSILKLRYVADVEAVDQFDSYFYNVFQLALAVRICEVLSDSTNKKALLLEELKQALREARKCNAFEKIPETQPDDGYWLARY